MRRAQTSVEYVILLAIVIVIAILVGNNLSGFSGLGMRTTERRALAYMSAQDVAVLNYVVTNESATLQIQNRYRDRVRVSDIVIAGTSCSTSDLPKIFNIGETETVTCSNINATGRYEFNVSITWKDIKNDATYIINDSKMLLVGKVYATALSSSGSGDAGGDETPSIPAGLTYDLFLVEDYTSSVVVINQSTNLTSLGVSLPYIGTTAAGYDVTEGSFLGKVFYNSSDVYWNATVDSATSDYQDTLDYIDTTGLVSYWRFDGNVSDSYGSNDGTNSGSTDTIGMVKHAREFDGADDEVRVTGFTGSSEYTYSVWFKADALSTHRLIVGAGTTSSLNMGYIDFYSGNLRHTSGTVLTPFSDITSWHHAAITRDSSGIGYLYLDGEFKDSGAIAHTAGGNIFIAGEHTLGIADFDGRIDEVMIFSRNLSATEVSEIYENQREYYGIGYGALDGIGLNSSNLVSYWPLDGSYDDLVGGSDGSCTNCPINATGISSGAMEFNGIDGSGICMGDLTDFDGLSTISFAAWIKFGEGGGPIISKRGDEPTRSFQFSIYDGGAYPQLVTYFSRVGTGFDDGQWLTSDDILNLNEWHHVATTVNLQTETTTVYVDGLARSITKNEDGLGFPTAIINTAAEFCIGMYDTSAQSSFNGTIDEVLIYDRSLSASEVTELYKAGLSQHADTNVTVKTRVADDYNLSDEGLVSLYSLEVNGLDLVGNNDGSGVSDPEYLPRSGIVGKGVYLDGNDFIDFGDNSDFDFNTDFTFCTWFNRDDDSGSEAIIGKWWDGSTRGWMITSAVDSGNVRISFNFRPSGSGTDTPVFNSDTYDFPATEWHHGCISYNGSHYTLYLDAVSSKGATAAGVVNTNNAEIRIGEAVHTSINPYNPLTGAIDEVRIYNRSLSLTEIRNLYELGSYHINWSDWQPRTNNTINGSFYQYNLSLTSDSINVSPYVHNVTIQTGEVS